MDRRTFLKRAGLGAVALGSASGFALPALAEEELEGEGGERRQATFVALSQGPTIGGIQHRIVMNGKIIFNAERGRAVGGGSLTHFDNAPPVPKPIIASGLWKTVEFLDYDTLDLPPYGVIQASILDVGIVAGAGEEQISAQLRVVCNVGPGGISTGEPEGFVLDVPESPFGPLRFEPLHPEVGLTHISTPNGG
jgi:hypothetical protein